MKNYNLSSLVFTIMITLISCSSEVVEEAGNGASQLLENKYEITSKQFEASGMSLGKVEKATFNDIIKAKGRLDVPPKNRANVSTFFGGTVRGINLLPGEKVSKGQKLFIIENPDFIQIQQNYLEAIGKSDYLESDFERQKNLAKDSVSSQKKYHMASSDYQVNQAKIASLAKKLRLMNINPKALTVNNIQTTMTVYAPISGYITEIMISEGTYLMPSQIAVKIVNPDHLHLELNVFENDFSKVKIGQPIQFNIQEDEDSVFEARIKLINRNVNTKDRTIGIHGHLVDEALCNKLIVGMYVEADIYTTSEQRWALPKEALVDIEGKFYLLELKTKSDSAYIFEKKEVKTGLENNKQVEILNANEFDESTEILTNGSFNLITE